MSVPSVRVVPPLTWTMPSMSCHTGRLPTLHHNEVRDITAEMIKEVNTNVEIELRLQPLDVENLQLRTANCEDEARLDLRSEKWRGACSLY